MSPGGNGIRGSQDIHVRVDVLVAGAIHVLGICTTGVLTTCSSSRSVGTRPQSGLSSPAPCLRQRSTRVWGQSRFHPGRRSASVRRSDRTVLRDGGQALVPPVSELARPAILCSRWTLANPVAEGHAALRGHPVANLAGRQSTAYILRVFRMVSALLHDGLPLEMFPSRTAGRTVVGIRSRS